MGVIGFDLRCSDLGRVSRKLGWPRKKSKQKSNNNNAQTLKFSDFERAVAIAPVAPMGTMGAAPVAFGLAV